MTLLARLNPSPAARMYLYLVGIAAGAVLVTYGVVDDDQLVVWLGLLAALLNVQAAGNTPTAGRHRVVDDQGE